MLGLIRDGEMHPSAAQVADRAGVSLRTVFRHFEEIESLNREIGAIIEDEILPMALKPLEARGWRAQLRELIARRAEIYERIMPIRIAASIRRFQSDYLMDDYRRFVTIERAGLESLLPKKIRDRKRLFAALEMVTGFQAWRRLRQDQGLSTGESEAVIADAVDRLIAGL
ncbi:MAG: TetR/AcrR family transcriptional regulator [Sphingomonadaceae bacterium]|nr:TetR/AcrR family transcriptional regulator [Sphingomonadaceae bacterium]